MKKQERIERIEKFNQTVKNFYGEEFQPDGETEYSKFYDYHFNRFFKKVGNKTISFQIDENELDRPYAIEIKFSKMNDAINFLKG